MKKFIVILIILGTFSSYAQEKVNEVRLNAFSVIAFTWLDVSYERVLNEESSVGIDFAFDIKKDVKFNFFGVDQDYAITPYYRFHIPKHLANGVFLEAFFSANGGTNRKKISDVLEDGLEGGGAIEDDIEHLAFRYKDYGFGLGAGYKYVSNGGFVGELYGGIGRNLADEKAPVIIPRVGVSFGFRF